mgnify:CR=1 FL=1
MLAAMDSCFGLFRPNQHDIASKQAQIPKNTRCNESAMLVECGYCNTKALVANLKATIVSIMAMLVQRALLHCTFISSRVLLGWKETQRLQKITACSGPRLSNSRSSLMGVAGAGTLNLNFVAKM